MRLLTPNQLPIKLLPTNAHVRSSWTCVQSICLPETFVVGHLIVIVGTDSSVKQIAASKVLLPFVFLDALAQMNSAMLLHPVLILKNSLGCIDHAFWPATRGAKRVSWTPFLTEVG